jgi:hypothetical protein
MKKSDFHFDTTFTLITRKNPLANKLKTCLLIHLPNLNEIRVLVAHRICQIRAD